MGNIGIGGFVMALKIWLDGKLWAEADAKVSVFDHGLLYGVRYKKDPDITI